MKITIKRYFERTRQIADFVPVKAACEVSAEYETGAIGWTRDEREKASQDLDQFCQEQVEKTLMGYVPARIQCGAKAIFPKKVLNKEGICAQCQSENQFKARDFAESAAKNARTTSAPKLPEKAQGRTFKPTS